MRTAIPLSLRKTDILILIFFFINILFITYIVDLEQLVIDDPSSFDYPVWPLPFMVDIVHWWGNNFDPVLIARPAWWRATIWIDSLFFGPFYIFAIYAFIKGREWIRLPAIIYSSVLVTNVVIILFEEMRGYPQYAESIAGPSGKSSLAGFSSSHNIQNEERTSIHNATVRRAFLQLSGQYT